MAGDRNEKTEQRKAGTERLRKWPTVVAGEVSRAKGPHGATKHSY